MEELQRAVARPEAVTTRLVKALESEGWIDIDANNVITATKDFIQL